MTDQSVPAGPRENVERIEAYNQGRWCGECRYAVVEDPPCCFSTADLLAAVPVPASPTPTEEGQR